MDLRKTFIRNLKKLRASAGLSQLKLAERCDVSGNYIGIIESGKRFPSVEMLEKLAQALKVHPYLFFFDGKTEKSAPVIPEKIKLEIIAKLSGVIRKY
ncbi:putative transcriptional regulators [Candidatus Termititenax aidoneus]|uniref:Transcriptional regulators n=1 Tax=Termititenax aidoneus TaxID=2218524 RepID=A0A388TAW4_TERA1|nr:putative transcriptional regulators [Candidatus Termititenax aidoneus]